MQCATTGCTNLGKLKRKSLAQQQRWHFNVQHRCSRCSRCSTSFRPELLCPAHRALLSWLQSGIPPASARSAAPKLRSASERFAACRPARRATKRESWLGRYHTSVRGNMHQRVWRLIQGNTQQRRKNTNQNRGRHILPSMLEASRQDEIW